MIVCLFKMAVGDGVKIVGTAHLVKRYLFMDLAKPTEIVNEILGIFPRSHHLDSSSLELRHPRVSA